MKRFGILATLVGLALLIALVVHQGVHDIAAILASAGFNLLWLVPLHVLPLTLDARGWQVLLRGQAKSLSYLTWIAAVREAVNRLLPAGNIGGEVVGVRLAALHVAAPQVVAASVIVEVLLTIIGQYLMCAAGIILTLFAVAVVPQEAAILTALALSLPVPFGLAWLLKDGALFTRIDSFAKGLIGHARMALSGFDGAKLDAALRILLGEHAILMRALLWQLSGMVLGCGETWLALLILGHPVGVSAAVSIEALSLAIRSVVFFIPGGLGVQEAGILMLGQLFGISSDMALSLALVKRMREFCFGVPALISWQWFEARRFRLGRAALP